MAPSKVNVKERLTDGEIDLSMSDIQDVPVKEIALLRKAYALDLSNNRLTVIPNNFASLTHITKLDLSKNELKELPENFGDLAKLKYLDLYFNKLQHLPLSFGKLKDLRWLDLKDNPLVPTVAKVAGPCLDAKQCQACAKDVVNFFVKLQFQVTSELEIRHKQRQKQIEINQQKKHEEKKNKKKEEKNKKKQVTEAQVQGTTSKELKKKSKSSSRDSAKSGSNKESSSLWKSLFFSFVVACAILFVLTSINTQHTRDVEYFARTVYGKCLNALPDNLKLYGEQVGVWVKGAHEKTGNVTMDVISSFKTNEHWQRLCDGVCQLVEEFLGKIQAVYKKFVT